MLQPGFVQKWFQQRWHQRSALDFWRSQIPLTKATQRLLMEESGQESMLDIPCAIPKHKYDYVTIDSSHNFMCYPPLSITPKVQPTNHQDILLMANPIAASDTPVAQDWSTT